MVLGVTGGIATGKSSVVAKFSELGAACLSADDIARAAVAPGSEALSQLAACFGTAVLQADGSLNRTALGQIVFADAAARKKLDQITHPAIARLAEAAIADLRNAGHALIVYEAPLLFEAGAESRVDQILVVSTEPDIQLQRLMQRDGINHDAAQARIRAQMPLAEKISRADYLIDNSDSPAETGRQVEALYLLLADSNPG